MLSKTTVATFLAVGAISLGLTVNSRTSRSGSNHGYTKAEIEHGAYLVNVVGGCNDCHTPKKMTPDGPVPDMSRLLSGHPASASSLRIPQGVLTPGGWGMLGTGDFTSYAGPWGISYAANITPDSATGIGSWTEKMFADCIREGKYWGSGRPLLPPMQWESLRHMTNNDLRDLYAYLLSIKPISNRVPRPVPPNEALNTD